MISSSLTKIQFDPPPIPNATFPFQCYITLHNQFSTENKYFMNVTLNPSTTHPLGIGFEPQLFQFFQ